MRGTRCGGPEGDGRRDVPLRGPWKCRAAEGLYYGSAFTAHTTNPVPFILINADPSYGLREGGCLADIVPTLLELMGMEQPKEMTGKSLLIRK